MIISLTIVSMVVILIYYAFSIGVQTWNRQDKKNQTSKRKEIIYRLIKNDFREISPYTLQWEKGKISFFAGGPQSIFYVTQHGLGASSREEKGLFFACLYLDKCPDGSIGLFLYKTPYPGPDLIQELSDFQTMTEQGRQTFLPSENIRRKGLLILKDLKDISFTYTKKEFKPFSGLNEKAIVSKSDEEDEEKNMFSDWVRKELPEQIRFKYEYKQKEFTIHADINSR